MIIKVLVILSIVTGYQCFNVCESKYTIHDALQQCYDDEYIDVVIPLHIDFNTSYADLIENSPVALYPQCNNTDAYQRAQVCADSVSRQCVNDTDLLPIKTELAKMLPFVCNHNKDRKSLDVRDFSDDVINRDKSSAIYPPDAYEVIIDRKWPTYIRLDMDQQCLKRQFRSMETCVKAEINRLIKTEGDLDDTLKIMCMSHSVNSHCADVNLRTCGLRTRLTFKKIAKFNLPKGCYFNPPIIG